MVSEGNNVTGKSGGTDGPGGAVDTANQLPKMSLSEDVTMRNVIKREQDPGAVPGASTQENPRHDSGKPADTEHCSVQTAKKLPEIGAVDGLSGWGVDAFGDGWWPACASGCQGGPDCKNGHAPEFSLVAQGAPARCRLCGVALVDSDPQKAIGYCFPCGRRMMAGPDTECVFSTSGDDAIPEEEEQPNDKQLPSRPVYRSGAQLTDGYRNLCVRCLQPAATMHGLCGECRGKIPEAPAGGVSGERSPALAEVPAIRTCQVPGCDTVLGDDVHTTMCAPHRRQREAGGGKCARKGCTRSPMPDSVWCSGHGACDASVTCDNLPAVNEHVAGVLGEAFEFAWRMLADDPGNDPVTVARCKRLHDLQLRDLEVRL
jgi:hypothetical protein